MTTVEEQQFENFANSIIQNSINLLNCVDINTLEMWIERLNTLLTMYSYLSNV